MPSIVVLDLTALRDNRVAQTAAELKNFGDAVQNWLKERRDDRDEEGNPVGRQHTRLLALEHALKGIIDQLTARLNSLIETPPAAGPLFETCRAIDGAVLWLNRLWHFYRVKFDQRADRLADLLLAADEVVWSCRRPAAIALNLTGPAPLCFVDLAASFSALEIDKPLPADVAAEGYAASLEGFARTLPIPLLGIPPWCAASPWWLVHIGHEVGHHVLREAGLVKRFQKALGDCAATTLPRDSKAGGRWIDWAEEVFADWYAIVAVGAAAGLALAHARWASPAAMLKAATRYPPAAIRLELCARLADKLKAPGPAIPDTHRWSSWKAEASADPALRPLVESVQQDLLVVDRVVEASALQTPAAEADDLCKLFYPLVAALDPGIDQVARWKKQLDESGTLHGDQTLPAARQVVAGALSAWAGYVGPTNRPRPLGELAKRTKQLIRLCAEPGYRAGDESDETALRELGRKQANDLLSAFGG